jgi:hypothetical protein
MLSYSHSDFDSSVMTLTSLQGNHAKFHPLRIPSVPNLVKKLRLLSMIFLDPPRYYSVSNVALLFKHLTGIEAVGS